MNNPNYMVRDLVGKNSTDRDDRPSYTSIIYGLALGNSEKGYVEVKLLGDGKNETKDVINATIVIVNINHRIHVPP